MSPVHEWDDVRRGESSDNTSVCLNYYSVGTVQPKKMIVHVCYLLVHCMHMQCKVWSSEVLRTAAMHMKTFHLLSIQPSGWGVISDCNLLEAG